MSYQKKSVMLQELEQAIRRKANDKSKHKETAQKVLQSSVQRKKTALRTNVNRDNRPSTHKNAKPPTGGEKPAERVSQARQPSIFNAEGEVRVKKTTNRRFDKLVSLIQYMVSSSEKAMKYISSTNFEAEFALKLYRSDKENLTNELSHLSIEDLVDASRSVQHGTGDYHALLDENTKLKKEILILEKEAEGMQKQWSKEVALNPPKNGERQLGKLREMLARVLPGDKWQSLQELLQKEGKFEAMAVKSQQNSKKISQIQVVITSLRQERMGMMDELRAECRSSRSQQSMVEMAQVQAEKQQLQLELASMKEKVGQFIESSKSAGEVEALRKSLESTSQHLKSLAKELGGEQVNSGSNEQLIGLITQHFRSQLGQARQERARLMSDIQRLQADNESLQNYKGENEMELEESEARMGEMLAQMQEFRHAIDQLQAERDHTSQQAQHIVGQLLEKDRQLQAQEEELRVLRETGVVQGESAVQLRRDLQHWMVMCEQNQAEFKQQIDRLVSDKATVEDRLVQVSGEYEKYRSEVQQELESTREMLDRLAVQKESLQEKLATTQNDMISNNYANEQLSQVKVENMQLTTQNHALQTRVNEAVMALQTQELANNDLTTLYNQQQQETQKMQGMMKAAAGKHQHQCAQLQKINQEMQMAGIKQQQKIQELQGQVEVEELSKEAAQKRIEWLQEESRELKEQARTLKDNNSRLIKELQAGNLLEARVAQAQAECETLKDSKEKLQEELWELKQEQQENSQIHESKMKQYVRLVRQILKETLQQEHYHEDVTLEELLEWGCTATLQMRKQQRDLESIERKNNREQYSHQPLSEESSKALEELSVPLFQPVQPFHTHHDEKLQPKQDKSQAQAQAGQDFDEFDNLKEESVNNSMVSDVAQQQKSNQQPVIVPLEAAPVLQDKKSKESVQEPSPGQIKEEEEDVVELVFPQLKPYAPAPKQGVKAIDDMTLYKSVEHEEESQSDTEQACPTQRNSQTSSEVQKYHIPGFNSITDSAELKPPAQPSAAQFGQFSDIAEQKLSQSMVSEQEPNPFVEATQNKLNQAQDIIKTLKSDQSEEMGEHALSAFGQIQQSMSNSMVSQKSEAVKAQQEDRLSDLPDNIPDKSVESDKNEAGLSDFGQLEDGSVNDSMLSERQQPKEKQEQGLFQALPEGLPDNSIDSKRSGAGLSEFGEVQEGDPNASMVSEQNKAEEKEGELLFDSLPEGLPGDSVISNKGAGFSDFGELQEGPANDSMLSDKPGAEEGANLDDFGEIDEQKMSASMMSQKSAEERV